MNYVQINHDANFAKDYTIKGSNAAPGESPFEPDVRVRPYKAWSSSRLFQTDVASRLSVGRASSGVGLIKPIVSPRIFYEQNVINTLASMTKRGLELDYDLAHRRAVAAFEKYRTGLDAGKSPTASMEEEISSIMSGAVMEDMMNKFTTSRGARITAPQGPNERYGFAEKPAGHSSTKSPTATYGNYTSVDGTTYTFRTHYAVKGELRPDITNILVHAFAELAKGGLAVAPFAAAQIKVHDSEKRTVADFSEIYRALQSEHGDAEEEDFPAPEVE